MKDNVKNTQANGSLASWSQQHKYIRCFRKGQNTGGDSSSDPLDFFSAAAAASKTVNMRLPESGEIKHWRQILRTSLELSYSVKHILLVIERDCLAWTEVCTWCSNLSDIGNTRFWHVVDYNKLTNEGTSKWISNKPSLLMLIATCSLLVVGCCTVCVTESSYSSVDVDADDVP